MKKIILALLITLSSFNVVAADKFICSYFVIKKYSSLVPDSEYDKVKHCAYSCILRKKCGYIESWAVGIGKEIADLIGDGNAEMDDLRADAIGIKLGKRVRHIKQCLPACQKIY
ncbi:hypothetical protein A9Q84_10105 [Halobacteriovorax marinus]|uniref:Lipoprotein n=1 Tax=Halobacteriovorax marinus TaxID=97084 RepID=A0A1Y5F710_9BACT|nr:hypothetical protein A9Q84_10105 [Halobacteriovorax marinus]